MDDKRLGGSYPGRRLSGSFTLLSETGMFWAASELWRYFAPFSTVKRESCKNKANQIANQCSFAKRTLKLKCVFCPFAFLFLQNLGL